MWLEGNTQRASFGRLGKDTDGIVMFGYRRKLWDSHTRSFAALSIYTSWEFVTRRFEC